MGFTSSGGAVGQWQFSGIELAAVPNPTVEQVQLLILNAAPTLAPAHPPLIGGKYNN
ncbi:hypothetical protein [uncultured Thermosynechococcus sp.]|uniref:hypothetical protein n=1 Tax=uncultured Thermosynechococcus sp. TaxID=436945 RepID=UPI00260FDAF6|nr:hypothetical protein [uncultured Thermosynechococcus sp.]